MLNIDKYNVSGDDLEFLTDLTTHLEENQMSLNLKFNDFSFQIDPCGKYYEVWNCGVLLGKYTSLDDLFLNFKLDNKPFIEQISKIEYN